MKLINKTAKKLVLATVTAAALLTSPPLATADNVLKEVFNVMTVNAGATSYESQTRNGVAFGSFSARFKLAQPQVIQFTPPSISAGCGGIDFFAGSMSLIKREELVQMGRTIAAGAAVYAFNLAVESICPSCAAGMAWLQNKLDMFNELTSASCQDVVNGLSDAKVGAQISQSITEVANLNGWQKGLSSYADTAVESAFGSFSDLLTNRTATDEDTKDVVPLLGNLIWNVLGDAEIENWGFGGQWDKTEIQQLLMSLTGSIIITDDAESTPLLKILTIDELVYGAASTSGTNSSTAPLKIYVCDPNEGRDKANRLKCTKTTNLDGESKSWKGLYYQAYEMIMGDGSALSGIANKVVYKQPITPEEKRFINSASVPLMSMMFYLGKDKATQITIAQLIANEMANRAIESFIDELHGILKRVQENEYANQNTSANTQDFLVRAISDLENEQATVRDRYRSQLEESRKLFDTFSMLLNSIKAQSGLGG